MTDEPLSDILSPEFLDSVFPPDRADAFFEALFADASEGAYDIRLGFVHSSSSQIELEFQLNVRPGKCLVCSLTFGLPNVFLRHPVIDIKGLVDQIDRRLGSSRRVTGWRLGDTRMKSSDIHIIPLILDIES